MPLLSAVLGAALAAAVVHLWLLSRDHSLVWVHPSFYADILPQSVINGLDFAWRDLLSVFMQRVDNEVRARFLNYLLMAWDQKLRLALYDGAVLHPSWMPIASFLYVVASPVLMYAAVANAMRDRRAGLAAATVYLSSIGFLSCFAMNFMPAKPLSTVGYLAVAWLTLRIDRRARPGQLLMETPGATKLALLAVLMAGTYLDELMFFAFLLPPILAPERFGLVRAWRSDIGRHARNAALFLIPAFVFALSLVTVIPYITRTYFDWTFDYFGYNANLSNQIAYGGEYPPNLNPDAGFIARSFLLNAKGLFEIALLSWPYTIAAVGPAPGGGLYSLGRTPIALSMLALGGFVVLQAVTWRTGDPRRRWLARVWLLIALHLAFITVLQLKHVPVVLGYNYGASFSVFFALLLGITAAVLLSRGRWAAWAAVALILYVGAVQISNFHPLNRNWNARHRTWLGARLEPDRFPFPHHPLQVSTNRNASATERQAIWEAWKRGGLEAYLRTHDVPFDLLSIVFELETLDAKRGVGTER